MMKVDEAPLLRKAALLAFVAIVVTFLLKWSFVSPLYTSLGEIEGKNKVLLEQLKTADTELVGLEKRVREFSSLSSELAIFKNAIRDLFSSFEDLEKIAGFIADCGLEAGVLTFDSPVRTRIPAVVSRNAVFSASAPFPALVDFLEKIEAALPFSYPVSLEISFPDTADGKAGFTLRLKTLYHE
jgi:hypothetical protein